MILKNSGISVSWTEIEKNVNILQSIIKQLYT